MFFRPLNIKGGNENFEIKGWYTQNEIQEQCRAPRLVRVGLVQHKIVAPTMEFVQAQRTELHKKIELYIERAAINKVNILCLQEAWST